MARVGAAGLVAYAPRGLLPSMPPLAAALGRRGATVTVVFRSASPRSASSTRASCGRLGLAAAAPAGGDRRPPDSHASGRRRSSPTDDRQMPDDRATPRAAADQAVALLLALSCALALRWLRATGLDFGLPAVYNPDEIAIMSRALGVREGRPQPAQLPLPDVLLLRAVRLGRRRGSRCSWLTGAVPSLGAFQTQFFVDPTGIYLAGRLLGVACGVATVVAHVARSARGSPAGAAGGLPRRCLLAVAPTAGARRALREARRAGDAGDRRGDRRAGHGWPASARRPTPASSRRRALVARRRRRGMRRGVLDPLLRGLPRAAAGARGRCASARSAAAGIAAPSLAALATALALGRASARPWCSSRCRRSCSSNRGPPGRTSSRTARSWSTAPSRSARPVPERGGLRPAAVAAKGSAGRSSSPPSPAWSSLAAPATAGGPRCLIAFPLAFLLFISNTVAAGRYLNPALPFLAVFAGVGGDAADPLRPALAAHRGAVITARCRQPDTAGSIGLFFRQTDTRTLAQRCIERHVPAGVDGPGAALHGRS